jgi:DNA-binding transcriptional LysR family regulator
MAIKAAGIPYSNDNVFTSEEAIIAMVEAGLGIYPAALWYKHCFSEEVLAVPIKLDVVPMLIVLAWRKPELDTLASDIADISREAIAALGHKPCLGHMPIISDQQ